MRSRLLPRVIVNFALTADGKVSTRTYCPTGFTSPADKRRFLEIRSEGDAVLVGRGTLENDNMAMGMSASDLRKARLASGRAPFPLRVMVSQSGRINPAAKVFQSDGGRRVIFSTLRMPKKLQAELGQKADIHLAPDKVDLQAMLETLGRDYAVRTVACEGGPSLFRCLLEAGCVDELCLTLAPWIFGGKLAPGLTGPPGAFLDPPVRLALKKMETCGSECFLRYKVLRESGKRGKSA